MVRVEEIMKKKKKKMQENVDECGGVQKNFIFRWEMLIGIRSWRN